jgi:hypothetical protein
VDPRTNETFYVGKGCGNRKHRHELDALKGEKSAKAARILAIIASGHSVVAITVKSFASEVEAYEFEAARAKTGRAKGTPNKTTALLKDAILLAATKAGGKDGLVGYLEIQAAANPGPFMALLGKVLPRACRTIRQSRSSRWKASGGLGGKRRRQPRSAR